MKRTRTMSSRASQWGRWASFAALVGCSTTENGAAGQLDAGVVCALASDCPAGQFCGPAGRCTFECREDRDCVGRGRCDVSVGQCMNADGGPATVDVADAPPPDEPPSTPDASDAAGKPPPDVTVAPDAVFTDTPDAAETATAQDVADDPPPPDVACGPEVCNGVDDDCNGAVDDLAPTGCPVGPCASGVRRCPPGLPPGTRLVASATPRCEPESFAPSTTVCRPPAGECDVAERCTGTEAACPPDSFAPGSEVCRPSLNLEACDPAERCSGVDPACPSDRVTRPPTAESCNNLDDDCDGRVDDDATCPSGQSCVSGSCVSAAPDGLVDPDTMASGITLLRDPSDGALTVVYTDGGHNEVRTARFQGRWSLATAFANRQIEKQGADLGAGGVIHAVINDPSFGTLYYATYRGGTWSTPTVVPGMPGSGGTIDLDAAGAVHVVSHQPLGPRRYTTNAGGSWLSAPTAISSSGTAPAAIVAADAPAPAIAHAVWNARRIDFSEAPAWSASAVSGYGVDQGPPMSMVARGGTLALAYVLTTDAYTNYSLYFQQRTAGGGWSERTEVVGRARALGPLELMLDESGARFIAFCNSAGEMRAATDRSGTWQVTPLTLPAPCLGALDALVANGRLIVAYRSTAGQLRVASFETLGL